MNYAAIIEFLTRELNGTYADGRIHATRLGDYCLRVDPTNWKEFFKISILHKQEGAQVLMQSLVYKCHDEVEGFGAMGAILSTIQEIDERFGRGRYHG